jgi:hypothetical protein
VCRVIAVHVIVALLPQEFAGIGTLAGGDFLGLTADKMLAQSVKSGNRMF